MENSIKNMSDRISNLGVSTKKIENSLAGIQTEVSKLNKPDKKKKATDAAKGVLDSILINSFYSVPKMIQIKWCLSFVS